MNFIPMVVKKTGGQERAYDLFSYLLASRIIFLHGPIDDNTNASIIAQLLFLEAVDPNKDVNLYINSVGGSVDATMGIMDTMNFIKPDVATWCVGLAASAGSILLSAGQKGKRYIFPNSRVMLHEPSGGYIGRSKHMEDHAKAIKDTRHKLINIYKNQTGQEANKIESLLDRESFFSPEEAVSFGLADSIVTDRASCPINKSSNDEDLMIPNFIE